MSSKWLTSDNTLLSSELKEWKDDDFEDLDAVMPGGDPGLVMLKAAS